MVASLIKTFSVKRDDVIVKYSCLTINKAKLMIAYDKGIAIDITELADKDITVLKKRMTDCSKNYNVFSNEKIFSTKYYGNSLCIIPSNVCQLQCKYCYSSSGNINSDKYVDISKMKRCIDAVFENRKLYKRLPNAKINFLFHGGGEPTENWPLFRDLVEYIMQKKRETNAKVLLKLVTNGIMDSAKAEWIAKFFDEIVVSIDGPHYINDKVRVFGNQKGTTKISTNVANIFGHSTKVGVHAVVTSLSIGKEKEIIDFFRDNITNLSFISFQRCRNTYYGRNEVLSTSVTEYVDFVKEAIKYAPDFVQTSLTDLTVKRSFCKGCSGNILYCFPNGNITTCNEHDDGIYKIGTYNDGFLIDPLLYQNYKKSVENKISVLACGKCFAFPFCRGGCHSYYLQCENYDKEWCSAFKTAIRDLLSLKLKDGDKEYIWINGKEVSCFRY